MHRLTLALAAVLFAGTAQANGRFPAATQLVVDPADAAHVVVRTTFGLLQSTDAGATWRFVCEEHVGWSGTFDPAIAFTRSGALLAGLTDGLSRSADRACGFSRAPAFAGQQIVDLAGDVVAVTYPAPGTQALFARSVDEGVTWSFGTTLPEDFVPATVDVAPTRPQRVYASGVGAFKAFASVVRSDDGGATWAESTFDMGGASAPYLAAVESDPERVWLRLDGDERDRLFFSNNGAVRFDPVIDKAEILGFALSPDGRVAMGGPTDGLWIAGADHVFAKVSDVRVRCLAWTSAGLWACGDDAKDGFTIGLSTDGGRTFQKKLRLAELSPLPCVAEPCAKAWATISAQLQPDAGPSSDAGTSEPELHATGGCQTSRPALLPLFTLIAWPMLRWRRARRR